MELYTQDNKFHNINNVINLQEIFPQYDLYIIDCIYRRFNNFEKALQYLFDMNSEFDVKYLSNKFGKEVKKKERQMKKTKIKQDKEKMRIEKILSSESSSSNLIVESQIYLTSEENENSIEMDYLIMDENKKKHSFRKPSLIQRVSNKLIKSRRQNKYVLLDS
tara:strand:+ start:731 stop:1219 length:489 start_codon:yes stop_codon:yes gene_type:complete